MTIELDDGQIITLEKGEFGDDIIYEGDIKLLDEDAYINLYQKVLPDSYNENQTSNTNLQIAQKTLNSIAAQFENIDSQSREAILQFQKKHHLKRGFPKHQFHFYTRDLYFYNVNIIETSYMLPPSEKINFKFTIDVEYDEKSNMGDYLGWATRFEINYSEAHKQFGKPIFKSVRIDTD